MNEFIIFESPMAEAVQSVGLRERQKRQRERRILSAARGLLRRKGYAATGLAEIARAARLAVGTVYNYFPSKPAIVMALLKRDTAAALEAGEAILKSPPADPAAAVCALFEASLEAFALHDRSLWRELVAASMTNPRDLGAELFGADVALIVQLTSLVEELQVRGTVSSDLPPGRSAIALYAIYFSWFMAYLGSDELPLKIVRFEIRKGVELVMDGLRAR